MLLRLITLFLLLTTVLCKIPVTPKKTGLFDSISNIRISRQTGNLLSGGIAGTISSTITCPLEVVKTQLQSSSLSNVNTPLKVGREILKRDGVSGFWRGLPPTLVGIIPARATYFWSYEYTKKMLKPYFSDSSVFTPLIAGVSAGIFANSVTNPIWMVKTRMQLLNDAGQTQYAGYANAVSTIYKKEGLGGFYRGVTASYWGASEGAIQFVVYENLKKRELAKINSNSKSQTQIKTLPKASYLQNAALSKLVASLLTYPHEVARTRMREQAKNGVFKYTGMWKTISVIAKEEGSRGLYAGMGTHIARVVPNSAIMFCAYEVVGELIRKREVEEREAKR
ncbi:hypothetical protein TrLO_g1734 [Triparma laevis f. longispina]|uniref:Mitochondrial carrier n=1 Tax=Triparma laevis f. longispina TaxID=1714387 RepID=A0A9W7C450_9STRA|nr:hypothetical protein TrLO_g1734 [Triparma laevis f. longispina]